MIDEARISNAAEYSSTFTPQTHLTASGSTKGLWKFDGQSTADSSGNGNNGTLEAGATYSSDVPGGGAGGSAGSGPEVRWLVSDHLGTPRIVIDYTGTLANVRRHDCLPFGKELFALSGGRSAALDYTSDDGLRQQFTQKERDTETGLDFFDARYYASTQGRFTSPDPLLSSGTVEEPQSWNRYSYVWNNPLKLIDPYGLYVFDKEVSEAERKKFNSGLAQARANLQQIGKTYGTNSNEYKKPERALNAYGAEGVNNGVTIYTQAGLGHNQTQTAGVAGRKTADNPTGQDIRVTFDKGYLDSDVSERASGTKVCM